MKGKMYRIGEFAKIIGIPVRTLRFYDQFHILKPKEIDQFTGYRYYNDENVLEYELIKLLKSVDFTLEEINNYKNNLSESILAQKQQEILEHIKILRKKYDRLTIMKEQISQEETNYYAVPNESEREKVLRRKYERSNIQKSA